MVRLRTFLRERRIERVGEVERARLHAAGRERRAQGGRTAQRAEIPQRGRLRPLADVFERIEKTAEFEEVAIGKRAAAAGTFDRGRDFGCATDRVLDRREIVRRAFARDGGDAFERRACGVFIADRERPFVVPRATAEGTRRRDRRQ